METRHTLLQRACQPDNNEAWDEFVFYYQKFIYYLLNRIGVGSNDIDDLAQEILLELWKSLPTYKKEKAKFRTWLSAIVRHQAGRYLSRKIRQQKVISASEHERVEFNAVDAANNEFEEMVNEEWGIYISNLAMKNVEKVYRGHAIEVFNMSIKGKSVESIANELGITTNTVYTLKRRVKSRLLKEIQHLKANLE
ncbi:sigma-70 family RNA polymerase sigma factor [Rubellicoccus peritrichatus]|uniref:RNA polymerase sigma factor SigS n=1 Tax=Rubellicoccus peritrichatus TaxID=3080537 RepID=A0AAQ3LDZ4_9BACT|nr:sigma-70 family RNA polymerase sigma factor [Puniceicoccus sp. CR14]WOO43632.1 sigma-70 family RNA polymerase sigma factor [Puniceicoccus sp. CR14]